MLAGGDADRLTPFFERLLLSIIDAYPTEGEKRSGLAGQRTREDRLQTAMQALFGEAKTGRRADSDDAVLRWMASQHYRDLAIRGLQALKSAPESEKTLVTPPVRSDRALAADAEGKFSLGAGARERLRKKFSDKKDFWLAIERFHDDVPELMETWLLDEIRGLLAKADIKTVPHWPDGRRREHELENNGEVVAARRKLINALYNACRRFIEKTREDSSK